MQSYYDQQLELFKEKLKKEINERYDKSVGLDAVAAGYNIGLREIYELIDTTKP